MTSHVIPSGPSSLSSPLTHSSLSSPLTQSSQTNQTNQATPTTMRIPRGLWKDLEESVIQQDRQFLTEVARSLGLPVGEVLRKVLGTGGSQLVHVLTSAEDADRCPWWDRIGDGLWRPCARQRMTSAQPCQIHTRPPPTSSPPYRLGVDNHMESLPILSPVLHEGIVYWMSETHNTPVFREDGIIVHDLTFKRITFRGDRIWVAVKT